MTRLRAWRPALWHVARRWKVLASVARHRRLHGDGWDELYSLAIVADVAVEGGWRILLPLAARGMAHAGRRETRMHHVQNLEDMADFALRRGSWAEAVRLAEHAGAIEANGPFTSAHIETALREAAAGREVTNYRRVYSRAPVLRTIVSDGIVASVDRLRWLPPAAADLLAPLWLVALNEFLIEVHPTPRRIHGLDTGPLVLRWMRRRWAQWRGVSAAQLPPGLRLAIVPASGDIVFRASDGAKSVAGNLEGPRKWPTGWDGKGLFVTPPHHIALALYDFHRIGRTRTAEALTGPATLLRLGGLLVGEALRRLGSAGADRLLHVQGGGVFHALPWPALQVDGENLVERFDLVTDDGIEIPADKGRAPRVAALWGVSPNMAIEARRVVEQASAAGFPAGDAAPLSRTTLDAALETATVLHIASHYIGHPHDARRGRLQLADGDWLEIDIAATACRGIELLFLAACESGTPIEGDGETASDGTTPWRLAGAQAVVATLWRIDDRHTPALADRFYAHLFAGAGRAAALADAQRAMLAETHVLAGAERFLEPSEDAEPGLAIGTSHPRIWAAFRLTGAAGPITLRIDPPAGQGVSIR
ncbi:CHAT domain-containing protein [Sphingomonas sp. KR3-1]|uniref:CHAT domain-containing protein n=1 Tax=Sphingomonas sp. KR3-1 TaxID=3156611 RepID=UPI0032B41583